MCCLGRTVQILVEATMQPTRWEILRLLKQRGRATVNELAQALDMTLMGVRLHLVVLDRDGYVRRTTVREKPGRPALVYSLAPKAEELFPKRYDLLAERLLEAIQQYGGDHLSSAILASTARTMAAQLAADVDGDSLAQRVRSVGDVLDKLGGFTSWERVEGGFLLHHHNCLFYAVALRNGGVCSIDHLLLSDLLGERVERRTSLLDGSGSCSFFVPDRPSDTAE